MRKQQARSSVRSIAAKAGVSASIVSAVLGGRDAQTRSVRFSAATAQRVTEIAGDLGYVPNRLTRTLIRKEAFALGVLAPWPRHERYNAIVRGLAEQCQRANRHLILESCGESHEEIMQQLRALVALQVGAVFMVPVRSANVAPAVVMREHQEKLALCPNLFCADWFRDELVFDGVESDERQLLVLPLRHLREQGHRVVGIIGNGTPRRRRFLAEVLAELGMSDTLDTALAGFLPNRNLVEDDVPELTRRLLSRTPRPTALYGWRDSFAASAYRVCEQEFGLRVGRDIALIGQDNTTLAQWLPVPLTSVSHRDPDFAAALFQLMEDRLGGRLKPGPVQRTLQPELVVRASSMFTLKPSP